jgi:hypothetical protein
MLVDEIFHDNYQGYGHYLDLDIGMHKHDYYNTKINIKSLEPINANHEKKAKPGYFENVETKYITVHLFYLSIIGYLSYSLLFKKL